MANTTYISPVTNYSELLSIYGVEYLQVGNYWQVGKIQGTQGWILHLSVIDPQLEELLSLVIPELLKIGVPFKIILDAKTAIRQVNGAFGYDQIGKMVCIYPGSDEEANQVAKQFIQLTTAFRAPAVPTDKHLGSIVYTRYGSFNPVIRFDIMGQPVRHIYDVGGQLVPDLYTMPFLLPAGIKWPFDDITDHHPPKRTKLLKNVYYPLYVLKGDAKGDVIRAMYFKRFWQIKSCIIKQGRPNMYADMAGRDIRDRLEWQHQLYKNLHADIPMPEVFDYFESNGDTYLAMEFIKGISFTSWINTICQDRSWISLSANRRRQLLAKLHRILDIIQTLHEKGFIHRDVTPDNFLIDKKGGIFMIDMELAWSAANVFPTPPFELGTPGHMSPEQSRIETPTVKEDIYGLGGLMVMLFTNLHAIKLYKQSPVELKGVLHFCTGDHELAEVVSSCWQVEPGKRPDLKTIQSKVRELEAQTNEPCVTGASVVQPIVDDPRLLSLVQSSINALGNPRLLNQKNRWVSLSQRQETLVGNQQEELMLSEYWHTGMSGPLWLVALAKQVGLSIDECLPAYQRSWDYLQNNYFPNMTKKPWGLYMGGAGIACTVAAGLGSQMIPVDVKAIEQLHSCFSGPTNSLGLAAGIAGQGLALLKSRTWIDEGFKTSVLQSYIDVVLQHQLPNGSWDVANGSGKKGDIFTGMDYGVAGISWFLLSCVQTGNYSRAEAAAVQSLRWLMSVQVKKGGIRYWTISSKNQQADVWSAAHGQPGIALLFIKAYQVLREPIYRKIAESILFDIPSYPSRMDFTLATGLAGLGEIYLEAYQQFKDPKWQERCDWIAALLMNCCITSDTSDPYWHVNVNTTVTADLFEGNSGLIHFLMRHRFPDQCNHPLDI